MARSGSSMRNRPWEVPAPEDVVDEVERVRAGLLPGELGAGPLHGLGVGDAALGERDSAVDHRGQGGEPERRRRAMPVRRATLGTLAATLLVLALVDAVTGIALPIYFWATLAIVVVGLGVGLLLRRTPWSISALLPLSVVGLVAFAGSHASLHDGMGTREWQPTTTLSSNYKLAFGEGTLDLGKLRTPTAPRTVHITVGAGQVRVIAPSTMNVTVQANIHIGQLDVDGVDGSDKDGYGGIGLSQTVNPPGRGHRAADRRGRPSRRRQDRGRAPLTARHQSRFTAPCRRSGRRRSASSPRETGRSAAASRTPGPANSADQSVWNSPKNCVSPTGQGVLVGGAEQHEREEEVVPQRHEAEDDDRGDRRLDQRQHHLTKIRNSPAPSMRAASSSSRGRPRKNAAR